MGLIAPLGLLGLALLAPVIAMYLLKRRREEVLVSSVFLWEQVVQDLEANAPWQKLRRNLLLLLQLLFLLAAIVGLARPFLRTAGATGQSLIVVLDSSLSMGARDVEGGTRLEAARTEALRLIEGLPDRGRVTLIRAGNGAEILAANSADRVALRDALAGLVGNATDSDLGPALTLAAAAAARQADSEIVILSDGAVTMPAALAVERPVRYLPLGSSAENQAISALELSPRADGYDLFVQVTNYGQEATPRRLIVEVNGQPFTADDLALAPGQALSKLYALDVTGPVQVAARLDEATRDVLAEDDRAWAVPPIGGSRRIRILTATPQSIFLRYLTIPFRIQPGAEVEVASVLSDTTTPAGEARPDLLVLDRWLPEAGLPGTTESLLILAPPPGNDQIQATGIYTDPVPIKLGTVPAIEESLFFEPELFFVEARGGSVPAWGTAVLQDARTGNPLLWVGEWEGRRVAVLNTLLFGVPETPGLVAEPKELLLTNLPFQPAYPVLMASLTDYLLAGPAGSLAGRSVLPGQLLTLPLLSGERVELVLPDGSTAAPPVGAGASVATFTPTEPGIYTVRWPGSDQPPVSFVVNRFTPSESRLAPAAQLAMTTSSGSSQAPQALQGEGRSELWRPLLLIALLLLTAEWLVYQKDALVRLRGLLRARGVG